MYFSTLEIGAAQFRFVTYRVRAEVTILTYEQKSYPVSFSRRRKIYPV